MLNFPKHLNLTIEHNPQKLYYQTVEQYIDDALVCANTLYWVPGKSRDIACETNEMWVVQWYPDTPIGFHMVYGHTLEAVLEHIATGMK